MKKTTKGIQLDSLMEAELANLKRGVPYDLFVPDTPKNRAAFALRKEYYQQIASAEGWELNEDLYRAHFLPPFDDRLPPPGLQNRIFIREKGNHLGYCLSTIDGIASKIQDEELKRILERLDPFGWLM